MFTLKKKIIKGLMSDKHNANSLHVGESSFWYCDQPSSNLYRRPNAKYSHRGWINICAFWILSKIIQSSENIISVVLFLPNDNTISYYAEPDRC